MWNDVGKYDAAITDANNAYFCYIGDNDLTYYPLSTFFVEDLDGEQTIKEKLIKENIYEIIEERSCVVAPNNYYFVKVNKKHPKVRESYMIRSDFIYKYLAEEWGFDIAQRWAREDDMTLEDWVKPAIKLCHYDGQCNLFCKFLVNGKCTAGEDGPILRLEEIEEEE